MKRNLLFIASLFLGTTLNAQFTEANTPSPGEGTSLFVVDSLAPSYSEITGSGVVWDYSGYGGYNNESRTVTVLEASQTGFAQEFPNSDLAIEIEDMLTNYVTNDENVRISQGFVFSEPDVGDVVVELDDEQHLMNYPFDFGDGFTDSFSGSTELMGMGVPLAGESHVSVDGLGTLILAENSYENVLRYAIVDTALIESFIGDFELIRLQYEYYDHSISNLPIFIYASITVTSVGGDEPVLESFVVLSNDQPSFEVGLNKNVLTQTTIYPNPASEMLTVQLPSEVATASLKLLDALGRVVYEGDIDQSTNSIDVSGFNKGTYILKITNDTQTATQSVIIQ